MESSVEIATSVKAIVLEESVILTGCGQLPCGQLGVTVGQQDWQLGIWGGCR